ncbi:hypothetical protein [Teredinibacter sp. KSP-S5-2]|uniref:hypothetical protein n=1 Tax=Teredinibacter sp. KSP-S5-2 TaxID=3034506 RepID=UPI0029341CCA|nr:hypothetical protein [Teredinibacter sp. KSP-S5-2]WNO10764.1 hypothetical protein P5V12_06200 [Teredinibacter sp. KSP-S5-2]
MRRLYIAKLFVTVLVATFSLIPVFSHSETLVAHKSLSAESLDINQVKRIFLGKITRLDSGETVRPCYLADDAFFNVIEKTASQFDAYWNKRIFSGTGIKPAMLESVSSVLDFVENNEGAICYATGAQAGDGMVTLSF